jgi:hypothetical protein
MPLSHTRPVASAVYDDPNLVSCAGLVPVAALAHKCGLAALADEHLSVPTDKGANAGPKVSCLVAGMVAGADSIDDMALLRHGAMGTVFDRRYAPSTLGSFLREFEKLIWRRVLSRGRVKAAPTDSRGGFRFGGPGEGRRRSLLTTVVSD